ncbi:LOW QUALITY PROTEIN: uncharacterized protein LOC129605187 [Condylostylus longicornis]|uniref:LOW QUALITY PROTEIN: uncharacterized protein LOC129605187 n=1 Tax=Condylostylus longicornis TaxID=2530218 RepID=UPI00244E2410|nr:LOW QUALITY PROTEIN: uncharacterized protein LOC129605187 [Condylostylus longicornis]
MKMSFKRTWIIFSCIFIFKSIVCEDVEVIKAIAAEEQNHDENESDQVALESNDQDTHKVLTYPHGPGPARGKIIYFRNRIIYSYNTFSSSVVNHGQNVQLLGQPFGPPPPSPAHMAYHGPPPPPPMHLQKPHPSHGGPQHHQGPPPHQPVHQPPPPPKLPDLSTAAASTNEIWASPMQDMPKIVSLDVKCEKNGMKVFLQFDKPFYGIVFSKGHYSNPNCVHLPAGVGRNSATFDIGLHACGTSGNTENGLYGYGSESGSGTYFENIIVIQYDPQVQEVWDQARKLRCTWHDQYEKSVTFRPFPVDMLDVVRADFAGDNVGCWMQIQVGKGPWASEVSGLVKIGQTMTMVLAIKDDDSKFDMLVRNCVAHDGKRAPIQLVDQRGCVTRPKIMSRFTKIKNFGASASVLSYAHFQAFKFPDSMEVHFQCTIQICRYQCPEQCSDPNLQDVHHLQAGPESQYIPSSPMESYLHTLNKRRNDDSRRDERRGRRTRALEKPEKDVGINRSIRVVSSGDLTFAIDEKPNATIAQPQTMVFTGKEEGLVCMTTPGFALLIIILLAILLVSCIVSVFLTLRLKPFSKLKKERAVAYTNPHIIATLPRVLTTNMVGTMTRPVNSMNGMNTVPKSKRIRS